jgi:hypothetical protein
MPSDGAAVTSAGLASVASGLPGFVSAVSAFWLGSGWTPEGFASEDAVAFDGVVGFEDVSEFEAAAPVGLVSAAVVSVGFGSVVPVFSSPCFDSPTTGGAGLKSAAVVAER